MHALLTQFAELCQRLAETGSKLEKRALMAEYLRPLPVPEAGWRRCTWLECLSRRRMAAN